MNDKYICNLNNGVLTVGNGLFTLEVNNADSVEKEYCDNNGLSQEFLRVKAEAGGVTREYNVWENVPAVEIPAYEGVFEYPISGNNYSLRLINLFAVTDYHDDFVSESVYQMFRGKIPKKNGNVFFLDDPLTKESIVIISTAPDYVKTSVEAAEDILRVDTSGHGFVIGKCKTDECEALCRLWYRHKCKPTELYTMANTWGDYNAYRRVADDFIKGEIQASSELGLDTLQIDDGWQKGNTDDPAIRDEKNRRIFLNDFWELKKEKFRNGMEEMSALAAEKGVNLGLWFAPDSQHCYERMERDISVLENAYKNWGMRYFKFDMLYVENMEMYKKFEEMLHRVYSFGDNVFVQLDVTNGIRNGYLGVTQYGRIFAENRYTKLKTYYPHRTLQNLWNICKYIPAFKFQFELVNPELNAEVYGEDDVFAPHRCDMDYLFAITMMSNPLFWMEVQFLSEGKREELNRVFPVWKAIRNELANADVEPIGEKPDGCSFTGFAAYTEGGKKAYLLVFREVNDCNKYSFTLKNTVKKAKVLATNSEIVYNTKDGNIEVEFGKMRSYALMELEF